MTSTQVKNFTFSYAILVFMVFLFGTSTVIGFKSFIALAVMSFICISFFYLGLKDFITIPLEKSDTIDNSEGTQ
jgi:hypothetical protein